MRVPGLGMQVLTSIKNMAIQGPESWTAAPFREWHWIGCALSAVVGSFPPPPL